ncbi:hypothetical protein V6N11_004210 [Hibiscus sabdariffa]|uniref:Uncharacterized protein n=1 Tax=Hibiscus sabdariffa TaxID=183260 RepID=A0ABR2SFR6_9ROSI
MSSHVQVLPGMAREFSCNRFFMRMELYQTWDHLDTSSHMLKAQVLLGVTSWFNSSCPPHLSMVAVTPSSPFPFLLQLKFESLREGRYLNCEKKDLFGSAILN